MARREVILGCNDAHRVMVTRESLKTQRARRARCQQHLDDAPKCRPLLGENRATDAEFLLHKFGKSVQISSMSSQRQIMCSNRTRQAFGISLGAYAELMCGGVARAHAMGCRFLVLGGTRS